MLCALGRHAFCWFHCIVIVCCYSVITYITAYLLCIYCVFTVYLLCIYCVFMHVFVCLQKNGNLYYLKNKRQSAGHSLIVILAQYLSTLVPPPPTRHTSSGGVCGSGGWRKHSFLHFLIFLIMHIRFVAYI